MASDPQTWEELKTAVADWSDRDDEDIDTQAARAIAFAERRFNRTLRVPEMETSTTLTVDAATEALPSDFLELRAIYLNTDPKTVLEQMTFADLRNSYPAAATGKPQNFAIQSGSTLVFGPSPDASYSCIINYYQKILALGSSQESNWLLLAHPDIYLFGAMAELCDLYKDEARANRYEEKLAGRIAELNSQSMKKAWGAAPLRIRSPVVV